MNTLFIHNIVSARLTPVKSTTIAAAHGLKERQMHTRDLILIDDRGHKTEISIFADETPEQIIVEVAQ